MTKAEALLAGMALLQYIQEQAAGATKKESFELAQCASAILSLLEWRIL